MNMKKLLSFAISRYLAFLCLGFWLLCVGEVFASTYVGGIVSTNTTWAASGSPYILTSDVQIASGVTLTIDPGVTVNGSGFAIKVGGHGTLSAHGASGAEIVFNDCYIYSAYDSSTHSLIDISHASINGGEINNNSSAGYISVILRDSIVKNLPQIHIWSQSSDVVDNYIERNVFFNTGGILVDLGSSNGVDAYVRNNVFQLDGQACGANHADDFYAVGIGFVRSNAGSQLIVEYNSFLSTNRVAIGTPSPYRIYGMAYLNMIAINNYWNTTDPAVIDGMIYDGLDDVTLPIISYTPFLTAPHANTPAPLTGQTDCSRVVRGSMNQDIGQYKAICANQNTHQVVTIPVVYGQTWDCAAAGLTVNKGDDVTVTLRAKIK